MIKFESKPAWNYLLQLTGDKLYNYFIHYLNKSLKTIM